MTVLDALLTIVGLALVVLGMCAAAPYEEVDPHALEGLVRVGETNHPSERNAS